MKTNNARLPVQSGHLQWPGTEEPMLLLLRFFPNDRVVAGETGLAAASVYFAPALLCTHCGNALALPVGNDSSSAQVA